MPFPRLTSPAAALIALALALLLAPSAEARVMLDPNPANDRVLVKKKLDPNRYDYADRSRNKNPKGMRKLIRWMKRNTKRNTYYGTLRSDGMHATGRALDWMLDARKRGQKRKAKRVINTWVANDKRGRRDALARRMGIQMIIYDCRIWMATSSQWKRYSACAGTNNPDPTQGHIDHIHIELNKPATRARTSFWRYQGRLSGNGSASSDGGVTPR